MSLDAFLAYFHKELNYLRHSGAVFASKHPKIARRLDWTKGESKDPHVERLLESFAYLSAQLHQTIDDRFPQIAAGLLNTLYPQLINPLPSVAMAHFQVDPAKAKMTAGYAIERHTPLFAYAEEGLICRFQTAYPLTLWPLDVKEASFVQALSYTFNDAVPRSPWYIKLTLKAQKLYFSDLDLDTLVFHLGGDRLTAVSLYKAIFGQSDPFILYSTDGQNLKTLPSDSLKPIGFERDEQLFPSPAHSHPAYQLLQEYFHFPEKYFFFQLRHLLKATKENQTDMLEIFIPVSDGKIISHLAIGPENFLLGCTPIINLFQKTTDPLRVNQRQVEYRLTADSRLERTHEIHSIVDVHSVLDDGTVLEYRPYYSFEHGKESSLFWYHRRQASDHRQIPGTDVYLSFVSHDFNPMMPPSETIFATTLCTNRFLAEQLPAGATLYYDGKLPVTRMICLDKPVTPAYSPMDGETLWKLVSQLSIHHLGYTDPSTSLKVIKETLHLYASMTGASIGQQIEALVEFKVEASARRIKRCVNDQAWMGFVEGVSVSLTLDEEIDPSGMSFVLAHVLQHFLAMNINLDSFIEMTLYSRQRKGVWMQWPPLNGQHLLL